MKEKSGLRGPGIFLIAVTLSCLMAPAICMAVPENSQYPNAYVTIAELTVTNASLPGPSALPGYRITPGPVKVQVELNETILPAPKGEMASGPRTIGVSLDPMLLAAGIIAIIAAGVGVLYHVRRNRDEEKSE